MLRGLLLFISVFLLSPCLNAGEGEADVRELCRTQVSGAYLGFMNDLDLAKSTLSSSVASSHALKTRSAAAIKELQRLEQKNEALRVPAADLDEELVGLRHTIDSLNDSLRDSAAWIATTQDQIRLKEREFQVFQASVRPIFEIAKAMGASQGAYPVRLQYRHGCSEFQRLCPLPKAQAESLLRLAQTLEDRSSCERYAQIH
jgi:hypothetical protein